MSSNGPEEQGGERSDAERPPAEAKREAWRHFSMSLLSFVVAGVLLFGLIRFGDDLVSLGLTRAFFYVGLVPVGLAAALVVHGVLKGTAVVRSTNWPAEVSLGGPAASAALVIYGGMTAIPAAAFSLTVLVHEHDSRTQTVGEGIVTLSVGADSRPIPIGPDGRATFPEIESRHRGSSVPLGVQVPGYSPLDTIIELDPTQVLYVRLPPVETRFWGTVVDAAGRGVPGAVLRFGLGNDDVTTDETGVFEVVVPYKTGESVNLRVTADGVVGHDRDYRIPPADSEFAKVLFGPVSG